MADRVSYLLKQCSQGDTERSDADTRQQGVRKLARRVELDAAQISRLAAGERGKRGPAVDTLRKVAERFPVSYIWLTLGEGHPEEANPWGSEYCRELEIAIAYHDGEVTPNVVERARAEAKTLRLRRTPREWSAELARITREALKPPAAPQEADAEVRRGIANVKRRPRAEGD